MIVIGLTGSIGMGKSTTAALFAEQGVPVHDADKTVHDLYSGKAASKVEALFPGTVIDGVVDRAELGKRVLGKKVEIAKLEAIIHPLVREAELQFLKTAKDNNEKIVLLDIPLLFETGGADRVDVIIVVSAGPKIQAERVLARKGMTQEKFEAILKKQMPDDEKKQRADFVIDSSVSVEDAKRQVVEILQTLRKSNKT